MMNCHKVIRRRLTWVAHCYKAVFRSYHLQLVPLFKIILEDGDLVIDVGAHAGQFSKIFSRLLPSGRILAVEPASYSLSILRVVHCLQRLNQVMLIEAGVGRQEGEALLHTPVKNSGVPRFGLSHIGPASIQSFEPPQEQQRILMTTIDKLVEQYGNDRRFSLIKADIEGWEYEMLCGAADSITMSKPCIFLEISNNRKQIQEFLWLRDYVIFEMLNYDAKKVIPLNLCLIRQGMDTDAHNILAVHASRCELLREIQKNFCV